MCMGVDDYLPHMGKVTRARPRIIGGADQVWRTLGHFCGDVAPGDQCCTSFIILIFDILDTGPLL
jgi:hypothetical protein